MLSVHKVDALPTTLLADALYLVKVGADKFAPYITDKAGVVSHSLEVPGATGATEKVALTDAPVINIDGAAGNIFYVTTATDREFTATNLTPGNYYTLEVTQGPAGSAVPTWTGIYNVPQGPLFPGQRHSILLYSPDGTNLVYIGDDKAGESLDPFDPATDVSLLDVYDFGDSSKYTLTGNRIDSLAPNLGNLINATPHFSAALKATRVETEIGYAAEVGLDNGCHIGNYTDSTASMVAIWRIKDPAYNAGAFERFYWNAPYLSVGANQSVFGASRFFQGRGGTGQVNVEGDDVGKTYQSPPGVPISLFRNWTATYAVASGWVFGNAATNNREASAQLASIALYSRQLTLAEQNAAREYWADQKGLSV